MNDEVNSSTIEENEEENDSLNNNIESTDIEEREISKTKERVSSHGRPVRGNSGSGV